MNDFTTDELEDILNGNMTLHPHTYQKLRDKIQSLIDNYCEHKRTYYSNGVKFSCNECKEIK